MNTLIRVLAKSEFCIFLIFLERKLILYLYGGLTKSFKYFNNY
jgi:hypothetical protein